MWRRLRLRPLDHLFADHVRLVELFSALNLAAWAWLLLWHPDVLERDTYVSFRPMGAVIWAAILAAVSLFQLIAILLSRRLRVLLRILAMSAAAGVWFVIGLGFVTSGIVTTADANYLLLSLICMLSGLYLGWTSHLF